MGHKLDIGLVTEAVNNQCAVGSSIVMLEPKLGPPVPPEVLVVFSHGLPHPAEDVPVEMSIDRSPLWNKLTMHNPVGIPECNQYQLLGQHLTLWLGVAPLPSLQPGAGLLLLGGVVHIHPGLISSDDLGRPPW